jgi:hypothetical protein
MWIERSNFDFDELVPAEGPLTKQSPKMQRGAIKGFGRALGAVQLHFTKVNAARSGSSYLSSNEPVLTFGLGPSTKPM